MGKDGCAREAKAGAMPRAPLPPALEDEGDDESDEGETEPAESEASGFGTDELEAAAAEFEATWPDSSDAQSPRKPRACGPRPPGPGPPAGFRDPAAVDAPFPRSLDKNMMEIVKS